MIEAVIDADGQAHFSEPVHLNGARRALGTIFADAPAGDIDSAALSEAALGIDWNRPDEDEAWAQLQRERQGVFPY